MIIKTLENRQIYLIFCLLLIFILNVSLEYNRYTDFKDENIIETEAYVLNIYSKDKFDILKLKSDKFDFFASVNKNEELKKFDKISLAIDTRNIGFISYLKGFYTKIIYFEKIEKNENELLFKDKIVEKIERNHEDKMITELFSTLFLAIPVSKDLRDIFTNYSISHVVALSGFHLVVLSFVIYWILYFPYSFFHQKYFPYRNKRFDILLMTISILLYYLILTGVVPSLLRAFVLFCLGIFLLRSNIKIISYMTLFFTFLIVIALFPKYIFSIGFWFSTSAVFYIYLFMQYFKNLNRWFLLVFFNFWMFLIFNPIVHYFFPQTALEQFYSIPITIFFTIFYPFEIIAHIFDFSIYFDEYIKIFLDYKFYVYEVFTPLYFMILYIVVSFLSIFSKKAFIGLNILMLGFNLYMYLFF